MEFYIGDWVYSKNIIYESGTISEIRNGNVFIQSAMFVEEVKIKDMESNFTKESNE